MQISYHPGDFSLPIACCEWETIQRGKIDGMVCRLYPLRIRLAAATTATMICCTGCLLPPRVSQNAESEAAQQAAPDPTHADGSPHPHPNPGTPTPAELTAAMAEVHQLGQSDPAVQQALVDDLRRTDPSLWPQLVHAYRTSLAYRRQSDERLALLARRNSPVDHLNPDGSATHLLSATPAAATSDDAASGQNLQSIYPSTSTPMELQIPITPAESFQGASPEQLPAASDGAILMPAATDVATNYPTTQYPEVRLAAAESTVTSPPSDDWQSQLASATRAMESRIAASANSTPSAADQAALRMLYLVAGRRDDAMLPLTGASSAEQEFWSKELAGLASLVEQQNGGDVPQHTADAARHLQQAATKLAQSTPLVVRNLAFCTAVSSYGVYQPLAAQTLKPGQTLLLYAEVENSVSEPIDKGYRTALKSRYELLDSRGTRVGGEDFGVTEEVCRNIRRDFFVRYFLKLPKPLPAGQYLLQLEIEDTTSTKSASGQIRFKVEE
ncbi:MAG: hypothetical protein IT427_08895 [Pirellulales bacterium]|nr:hypothetical protein [Pirellulales bacterium]